MTKIYRAIGCSDCRVTWRYSCGVCKKRGYWWVDKNSKRVRKEWLPDEKRHLWNDSSLLEINISAFQKGSTPKKPNKKHYLAGVDLDVDKKPIQPTPISVDNFFIRTKGTWKEIPQIPDDYELNWKSKRVSGKNKCASEYYVSPCGEYVVRKADHWGSHIKLCDWFLEGFEIAPCSRWSKIVSNPIKIGIIKFSDLEPN